MSQKLFKAEMGAINALGQEVLDPTPVQIPAGFKQPERLAETIQRLVRRNLSELADQQGYETFEESEDFNVDDESFDPATPYETFFDPYLGREITPLEFTAHADVYQKRYKDAQAAYFEQVDRDEIMRDNLVRAAYRARQRDKTESGGEGGPPPSPSSEEAS